MPDYIPAADMEKFSSKFLVCDTNSPYDDHTPLATAGVAEVREYQASSCSTTRRSASRATS